MKFGKDGKEQKGCNSCPGCGPNVPSLSPEAIKQKLAEMQKNKVSPQDCPYKATCETMILEEEAKLLCHDGKDSKTQETEYIHLIGKHVWFACKSYLEKERNKELTIKGKKAKDW